MRGTVQSVGFRPVVRRLATELRLDGTVHPHAHLAACLAEHGAAGPVVGVALDGLSMGDDGTFWGSEALIADLTGYRRFGRALLPGDEAAIRQPRRMALGYLFDAKPAQPGRLPYRLTERGGLTVYDPRPTLAAQLAGLPRPGIPSFATTGCRPGDGGISFGHAAIAAARLAAGPANRPAARPQAGGGARCV